MKAPLSVCIRSFKSPIGWVVVKGAAGGIEAVDFLDKEIFDEGEELPHVLAAISQLQAYFHGTLTAFDLPLAPLGTDFQRSVWNLLLSIPFGETRSYMDLAQSLRNEKAIRAVGAANGKNPIAIIVPCHRVIGSDGSMTGYAGGIHRKKWLLEHEKNIRFGKTLTLFE